MIDQKVDVILLCGGKGTRFVEVTDDKLPKSLYSVNGKELIRYTLDTLDIAAIRSLIFAVDHHDQKMVSWIDAQDFPCETIVSYQSEPGIVGALRGASEHIKSTHFIICNTDEIRHSFSAKSFLHESMKLVDKNTGAMATAFSTDLFRHRVIIPDSNGVITTTQLKSQVYKETPHEEGMVNIGFLLLPKAHIDKIDDSYGCDWSSIVDPLVYQRTLFSVPFRNVHYFNVGTVTELNQAASFFEIC